MASYLNKNSGYVASLTSFIADTKPYHSKLTEIVEEYQFYDTMSVVFSEKNSLRVKTNPAWLYNYYSGGDSTFRTVPLKQLHVPHPKVFPSNASSSYRGAIRAFRDENTDLMGVPYVYSKEAFDGAIQNVFVERNGDRSLLEPLTEGFDFFRSHGSMQFRIKQTTDAGTNFVPSWAETRNEDVISTAQAVVRELAHDVTNPNSAVSKVKALLLEIRALPLSTEALAAVDALLAIVAEPRLPRDYETLMNQLVADGTGVLPGYNSWNTEGDNTSVLERFSQLSPGLYFNLFSDADVRESGDSMYEDILDEYVQIKSIVASSNAVEGDTWKIVAQDTPDVYSVFSTVNGYIGAFDASTDGTFSTSTISFTHTRLSTPAQGYTITIRNKNRVVFAADAPLEVWNLIKTSPMAYSRPVFLSARYGYIQDANGNIGKVTILNQAIPTSTITLTARAGGQYFDVTSDTVSTYSGLAQVDVLYNDGEISFKIVGGTAQAFNEGDKFYIAISNEPAKAVDVDLGYGYDLDSYDVQDLSYGTAAPGKYLDFKFDTRFSDYDLSSLNLVVDQSAVSGRQWRVTAVPDLTRPLITVKKDGTTSSFVDLQADTSGVSPDPALNAPAVYETIGQTGNGIGDLQVFLASQFEVTYSDDNFQTVTSAGFVNVGDTFVDAAQGISFTLANASKPFIGVKSDGGDVVVAGGDVFSFTALNSGPVLVETVIGGASAALARLVMHADGFYDAPDAKWTVLFTSPTAFTVTGIRTSGAINTHVPGSPATGSLSLNGSIPYEGYTWNALGVNFTIVPGAAGFAAGDRFEFTTSATKPMILVHGSVSGWQADASYDVPYWNGKIGFAIDRSTARLFNQALADPMIPMTNNVWTLGTGTLTLTRLRIDTPDLVYTLTPTPTSGTRTGWYVTRSDVGAVGHLSATGTFSDKYVTLTAENIPEANIVKLQLQTIADNFGFWNAQDTVILRSVVSARLPTANDYVLVDKRVEDRLALNLRYDSLSNPPSLAALAPYTIDQRFIDLSENNGLIPVSNTSPETAIFTNWIPLTMVARDSATSNAESPDAATSFDLYAAGSGIKIGTIAPTGSDPYWPVSLTWAYDSADSANSFFTKYLPLNAEANIVTYSGGLNDKVNVRISETLNILIDGGALSTDYLFTDDVNVRIDEYTHWAITQLEADAVGVDINDGPFAGFLPGYDTEPYDEEQQGYDSGVPMTGHFMEARQLAGLDPMNAHQLAQTPAVRAARLADLVGLLHPFLVGGVLANTSLAQFLAAIDADPFSSQYTTTGFGIPAVGHAIGVKIGADGVDANKPSTEGASTAIQDALVVMAVDPSNSYDTYNYDIGAIDTLGEKTAMIYTGAVPPIPNPLPGITTYAEFETPLAVVGDPDTNQDFQARVFELNFRVTAANKTAMMAMPTPHVFIWLPTEAAPRQIPVVEKIATGRYRFSLPGITEAKIYLQPGS